MLELLDEDFVFLIFLLFRATPEANGGSQARGPIGAKAARHSPQPTAIATAHSHSGI